MPTCGSGTRRKTSSVLRTALERFGAPQETIDGLGLAAGLDVVWMGHPPARIDLMKDIPGGNFEMAWATHQCFDCGGTTVHVVGRKELIRLKRTSGRPQDLFDAEKLETLDED